MLKPKTKEGKMKVVNKILDFINLALAAIAAFFILLLI